jgi:hypothetical protein
MPFLSTLICIYINDTWLIIYKLRIGINLRKYKHLNIFKLCNNLNTAKLVIENKNLHFREGHTLISKIYIKYNRPS